MNNKKNTFILDMKGTPLLDDVFDVESTLALVCAVRKNRDASEVKLDLAHYLQPDVARKLYAQQKQKPVDPLPSTTLSSKETNAINLAIDNIILCCPNWNLLFNIPLTWDKLTGDSISSTNPLVPQHIQLGDRSFNGSIPLEEHIVHEISHTWVAITLEVSRVAEPSEPVYTLPSGTKNKDITQVILALTFACSANKYYFSKNNIAPLTISELNRVKWLQRYAEGCIKTAVNSNKLTANGFTMIECCENSIKNNTIAETTYA